MGVLFFPLPFIWIKKLLALTAVQGRWVGLLVRVSERESKKSTCEKDCLWKYSLKNQMPARVEKNLWLCASVRGRGKYECVPNDITRTFSVSWHSFGLCFLSPFSINQISSKTQRNVYCYEYLYSFIAFSCCLIWCECCVWLCALFSPCYHPLCANMWLYVEVCMGGLGGWGGWKWV